MIFPMVLFWDIFVVLSCRAFYEGDYVYFCVFAFMVLLISFFIWACSTVEMAMEGKE